MELKNSVIVFGSTCAIAFVFLLLFQQYIVVVIIHTHPNPISLTVKAYIWYTAGLLLGGLFSPRLLRFMRPPHSDDGQAKRRTLAFAGANAAAILLMLLSVVYSDQLSEAAPILRPQIASFTLGAMLPVALMLLFAAVPEAWHGRSLGILFAFMELFRLVLLLDLAGDLHFDAQPPPGHLDFFLHTLRRVLFVLLGAVACVNLALWRSGIGFSLVAPGAAGGSGQAPPLPGYRRAFSPYILAALTGLCFIMCGLVGSEETLAFMYFKASPLELNVAFCLTSLAVGICIDAYGRRAVGMLVTACACIFLFIPLLVAIEPGSMLYNAIHHVGYTAQHAFALVVLVVLGRAPHDGRFPGLMCVTVPVLRGGAFFMSLALQNAAPLYTEAILIGSLVLAVSMLIVALRSPSLWPVGPEAVPAPMTPENFARYYRLSPRDEEVMRLLLEGADTPAIATALGIAPPGRQDAGVSPEALAARYKLTPKMCKALHLLLEGANSRAIAEALDIFPPAEKDVMSPETFAERYQLTPRMREVLSLLLKGANTKDISVSLGISQYTARLHVHHILRKAQLHSRKSIRDMVGKAE